MAPANFMTPLAGAIYGRALSYSSASQPRAAISFRSSSNQSDFGAPLPALMGAVHDTLQIPRLQRMQISAGQMHSGCLTHEGQALMWGSNRFWALGLPQAVDYDLPTEVRRALY